MTIAWSHIAQIAAAWLATYWLHSTLLLGGAWLAGRLLRNRHLPTQEALWKVALVGGLLTATLQLTALELGAPRTLLAGAWTLSGQGEDARQPVVARLAPPAEASPLPAAEPAAQPLSADPAQAAGTLIPSIVGSLSGDAGDPDGFRSSVATAPAVRAGTTEPPRTFPIAVPGNLSVWLMALWGAVALLLGARLISAHARLLLRLSGRQPILDGPISGLLARLRTAARLRRPVGLSRSRAIPVPIARGLARGEICLPQRAIDDLDPRQQESILAHELAHVSRRDPAWLLLADSLAAVFFFQPLHRVARHRLREIAEYRCDDWAARITGEPLSLARCLTEIAAWRLRGALYLPVPGIAAGRSGLSHRIRRLVERGATRESRPRWLLPAAAAILALIIAAAPGVQPWSTASPADESLSEAAEGDRSEDSQAAEVSETTREGRDDRETEESREAARIEAAMEAELARQQDASAADQGAWEQASYEAESYHYEYEYEPFGQGTEECESCESRWYEGGEHEEHQHQEHLHEEHRHEEHQHEAHRHEEHQHEPRYLSDEEIAAAEIEAAFSEQMERLDEELERALEPLERDLEQPLEQWAEQLELDVEIFEEDFVEEFEEMMEAFEESLEEIDWDGEMSEAEVSALFAQSMGDLGHRIGVQAAAMAEALAPAAQLGEMFGSNFQHQIQVLVDAAVPNHDELARLEPELDRLRAEAQRLAAESRFAGADAEALREQARALAEELAPTQEELDRLRAETQRLIEESMPSREELDRIRAEQRKAMETWRREHSEEMRRLREEIRVEQDRLRVRLEESRRTMEERQRHREDEVRARVEAQRQESERQREEVEREVERKQREVEKERQRAEREAERKQREVERERERIDRDNERKQREAEKERERAARESERQQREAEREAERRQQAEGENQ